QRPVCAFRGRAFAARSNGGEVWNSANGCLVLFVSGRRSAMNLSPLSPAREAAMAWTNNDDVRWDPGETSLNAGRTLYWLATVIAAVMVIFAIADFFISWAQGAPIVRVFALVAAALVWLIGRALRAPSRLRPTKARLCHLISTIEIAPTGR